MKTRLLGAAVLIALAVLFVPMFFSSKPPAAGGDQSLSLAIPPAPDGDLKTKTMRLNPNGPVGVASDDGPRASGDRLPTVDIGSRRPGDVGTDAAAPNAAGVNTGSGASPAQPVIPMQNQSPTTAKPTDAEPRAAVPAQAASAAAATPDKTAAPTEAAPANGSYSLNLSAYASEAGAARLQKRVRALGYPVTGHAITQGGKPRTMIIAGPFETRTAAEAARLKITQSIPGVPAKLEQDADSEKPVPAAKRTASSKPGGYAVQLAAVSSKADAEALRDTLRKAGFDGFVDSVQSGGKRLWRVRAGPQTQRSDAQRVHDQIKQKLHIDGNVVSVP